MTREEIFDKVETLILKTMKSSLKASEITEDFLLASDIGMDSIDYIELTIDIDKFFGINTNSNEIEKIWNRGATVKDIVDLIIKTKEEEE